MSLFNNKVFSIKSACFIFAALGIIDYALRAQITFTSISDIQVGWNNIQETQAKENVELMNIFGILFVLSHLNAGLNILGSIILSSLLYGVISEKQHFLSPSLYFIPLDVILRTVLNINLLLVKIPENDIDPITVMVTHLITILILNITWLLIILYKQQIQNSLAKKEKLIK